MSSLLLLPQQQQWSSSSSSSAASTMSSVLLVSARHLLEASNASSSSSSSSSAAAAPNSSDPYGSSYGLNSRFNPSMAIIIVVLLSAFFFMGFFSVYIRRCTTEEEPRLPRSNSGGAATGDGRSRSCRGLDKDLVDSLPLVTYSAVSSKDNSECVVCLSEFQDIETLRMLPKCGHAFHQDCIDMWLFSHTTCPLCRRSLLPEKASSFRAFFTFGSTNRGARMDVEASDNSGDGGGGEPENGLHVEQQRSPTTTPPQNGGSRIRAAIVRKLRRSNSTGHSSTAIARPPFVTPPLENVEEDNSSQSFNFRMPLLASDFHRSRSVTELAHKNPWFGQQEEEEDPSKHEDPKRSTSFSFWLPNTSPQQEAPSTSNTEEEQSASPKPSFPSLSSSMRRSLKLFSGLDKPSDPITQLSSSKDVAFHQFSRIL